MIRTKSFKEITFRAKVHEKNGHSWHDFDSMKHYPKEVLDYFRAHPYSYRYTMPISWGVNNWLESVPNFKILDIQFQMSNYGTQGDVGIDREVLIIYDIPKEVVDKVNKEEEEESK